MSKGETLTKYIQAGNEWDAWWEEPEETRKEEKRNAIREREEKLRAKAIAEGAKGVDFAAIALASCSNEGQKMSIINSLKQDNTLNLSAKDFEEIDAEFIAPLQPDRSS